MTPRPKPVSSWKMSGIFLELWWTHPSRPNPMETLWTNGKLTTNLNWWTPDFWTMNSLIWPNSRHVTNLDLPEMKKFTETSATFWGPRSCEVAIIWPDPVKSTWNLKMEVWFKFRFRWSSFSIVIGRWTIRSFSREYCFSAFNFQL